LLQFTISNNCPPCMGCNIQDSTIRAEIYISNNLTDDPRPLKKYKDWIIEGAIEHKIPEKYIDSLKEIPTKVVKG
ncbi:gamma-glutamylcyclotransferase, partial [candidate division KSB1 bacterium]